MVIGTPIRWLLMGGVAACGYFMITGSTMNERAYAFLGSVVCWQAYYLLMIWEADMIRAGAKRKCTVCGKEMTKSDTCQNAEKDKQVLLSHPERQFALYCLK